MDHRKDTSAGYSGVLAENNAKLIGNIDDPTEIPAIIQLTSLREKSPFQGR
jgi:hypothetical protein